MNFIPGTFSGFWWLAIIVTQLAFQLAIGGGRSSLSLPHQPLSNSNWNHLAFHGFTTLLIYGLLGQVQTAVDNYQPPCWETLKPFLNSNSRDGQLKNGGFELNGVPQYYIRYVGGGQFGMIDFDAGTIVTLGYSEPFTDKDMDTAEILIRLKTQDLKWEPFTSFRSVSANTLVLAREGNQRSSLPRFICRSSTTGFYPFGISHGSYCQIRNLKDDSMASVPLFYVATDPKAKVDVEVEPELIPNCEY